MAKYNLICADPPWSFFDGLKMSETKRGASSQYPVMTNEDIKNLNVKELASVNSVLALWVPSSLLQEGLETMSAWGFRQTQTHIWIKIKKQPFLAMAKDVAKAILNTASKIKLNRAAVVAAHKIVSSSYDWDAILAFGLGRLFRQCHEICLIGVRGKPYADLKNKSMRSVHFDVNLKHSAKPEILQDRLALMFPSASKLEIFARRVRSDYVCVGLECPSSPGEDIRDSIDRLIKL